MKRAGSAITGFGEYRPVNIVTNDEINFRVRLEGDWIAPRTGIHERRHADEAETIPAMAEAAGTAAILDAGLTPDQIDLVILASATMSRTIPSVAAEVADRVGAAGAGAFDLNAVCASFTYGLSMASDAVRMGNATNVLVVGSERLTDWTTPEIPDVFAIFGDGAAAAVVSASDEVRIGPPVWGSDGKRRSAIEVPHDSYQIHMDGNLVYKWAITTIPAAAREACRRFDIAVADIDWFVPHQANDRIISAIARSLDVPPDKVISIIADTGNTSAASVPSALARLRQSGRAKGGDRALLTGFGAGLTFAAQIIVMP